MTNGGLAVILIKHFSEGHKKFRTERRNARAVLKKVLTSECECDILNEFTRKRNLNERASKGAI